MIAPVMHFPDLISGQKVAEACPLAAKIQNALSEMHSVDEGAPSLGLLRWKYVIFPSLRSNFLFSIL